MINVSEFLLQFFQNKRIILVLYTYHFFTISIFYYEFLKHNFMKNVELYRPYIYSIKHVPYFTNYV